jgi:predicted component of type VI protein secretion system
MSTDKPHLIRIDNLETRTLDRKVVIGRHPACDYVLSINDRNIGISGRHAAIEADGETAWLEDLGSTNGTWVQGERIGKRTRLVSGDRFQLDRLEFEFRAAVVRPAAPPPAPPPQPEAPKAPTTVAVNLEDLALPSPEQLKQASAKTAPPRVEPQAPPPARPAPVAAPPPPPPPPPPPRPARAGQRRTASGPTCPPSPPADPSPPPPRPQRRHLDPAATSTPAPRGLFVDLG